MNERKEEDRGMGRRRKRTGEREGDRSGEERNIGMGDRSEEEGRTEEEMRIRYNSII